MILPNSFRTMLDAGKPTLSTHLLSPDPDLAEIVGDLGLFDYAEFGAEYASFTMDGLYHLARAAQCAKLPMMIKLDQESQGFWAQAAIGAGFHSVLFTDIRSADDIAACHGTIRIDTPKSGGRMGVKLRRPALAGYEPESYLSGLADVVFAIMIEKTAAVDDIDAVLARAREFGVDMTQWGPADFGVSFGRPDMMFSDDIRPHEERVIAKSLEYGIAPRIEIAEPEQAKRYLDLGVRHFCIGWDRMILKAAFGRLGEDMRKLLETV